MSLALNEAAQGSFQKISSNEGTDYSNYCREGGFSGYLASTKCLNRFLDMPKWALPPRARARHACHSVSPDTRDGWMEEEEEEEEEEREGRFVLLPHYVAEEDAALTKRGAPPMLQLRELPLSIIITANLLL